MSKFTDYENKISNNKLNSSGQVQNSQVNAFQKQRRVNRMLNAQKAHEGNTITTLFAVVFVIGVLSILFKMFVNTGAPVFSFEHFLDFFRHVPSLDISFLSDISGGINKLQIPQVLKGFINFFWQPISMSIWILARYRSNNSLH